MAQENQNQFKCSGNCLNCSPAQRAYCASQHSYSNMKVLDTMMGIVLSMQTDMEALSEKIEALQNNEAVIFDPNEAIAQDGDGAEEEPQDIIT